VAAVQMHVELGAVDANLENARNWVRQPTGHEGSAEAFGQFSSVRVRRTCLNRADVASLHS
jgi:hypothetical protein